MSWETKQITPKSPLSCLLGFSGLLLLLCLLVPAAVAEPEAVTAARQSVVHLYGVGTDSESGTRLRWAGTGIAVGIAGEETNTFLTNWHVVSGNGQCQPSSVRLWILRDNAAFSSDQTPLGDCAVPCQVLCATDGYPDVAIIQTAEPIQGCLALPLLSSGRVAGGTEVYAMGFPGISSLSHTAPEDVTVTQGTVRQRLTMVSAGNTHALIHSAAIAPGFSGGPLVNVQGEVVAVNTYGFETDVTDSLFCAVYTDYAMELLEEMKIPYTKSPGDSLGAVLWASLQYWLNTDFHFYIFSFFMVILAFSIGMGYYIKYVRNRFRHESDEPQDWGEYP